MPAQLQCSRSGAWEPGNEARSNSLQAAGQRVIHNVIDKYVGKTLLTTISCTVRFVAFCFTIELHVHDVQALPAYSPSHPMP